MTNEILTRLREGASPEDIAREMTAALNKAEETYKAETATDEKYEATVALLEHVQSYLKTFYGIDAEIGEPQEVMDMLDLVTSPKLASLFNIL